MFFFYDALICVYGWWVIMKGKISSSGTNGFEGVKRFITGFKAETFLYFLFHELDVLEEVIMRFNAFSACHLNHLDTIVTTINTGCNAKCTWEQTVLNAFDTVVHSRSWLSALAINANRSTKCPAAGIAEKLWQSASFNGMPLIDTGGNVASTHWEPVTLATFLQEVSHLINK